MARIKTGPKVLALLVIAAAIFFGLKGLSRVVPARGILKTVMTTKVNLPDVRDAQVANVDPQPLPSDQPAHVPFTLIRGEMWEWNAEINLIFANGGSQTTKGSLMEKHGVNLLLSRQDDNNNEMINDTVACAKELSEGAKQCSTGANFIVVMGDGVGGHYLSAMNPLLRKLGPEWQAKVIAATGYSRGEDAFLADPLIKSDPQKARGLVVAGVKVDGDWNIALKWEGDNGIPNNPDPTTYDPDAVNWLLVDGYLQAADAYNANQCDERRVVRNGHFTGETKHACVNAVVTWTPGDVNIATHRGGLIKIVSSKQYRSQMPAVIVGPMKFFSDNRTEVEGMVAAMLEAGDQIKAFDQSLKKAADISAKLYNDQTGDYWYRYYKGVSQTDTTGLKVDLGGSAVNNMADEKILFGMEPGSNDNFRSTYTTFRNIDYQQYPDQFKGTPIPEVSEVENTSFIRGAEDAMNGSGAVADVPTYTQATADAPVVSRRAYHINFDTGSASITKPDALATMGELKDGLAITSLEITVSGYTDSTGDPEKNRQLSEDRAESVKRWLQKVAPRNFPDGRFVVHGYGDAQPIATNATAEGKAQNRRVEIILSGS